MTARQANRAGRPWQRKDGRWSVRAYPPGGKPKMVYGATEDEVLARQADAEAEIRNGVSDLGAQPEKPRTTRITLDLDPEAYTALNRWLGTAAAEAGAPVSKARALRAMITATVLDKSIGITVIDLLRRDH
jgi:hypothetical protein